MSQQNRIIYKKAQDTILKFPNCTHSSTQVRIETIPTCYSLSSWELDMKIQYLHGDYEAEVISLEASATETHTFSLISSPSSHLSAPAVFLPRPLPDDGIPWQQPGQSSNKQPPSPKEKASSSLLLCLYSCIHLCKKPMTDIFTSCSCFEAAARGRRLVLH